MKKSSRPYHRAGLKQALLRGALDLIAGVGVRAFTLREVARRARVSHNAPYRHFRDKEELLAAVAAEGFDRLTAEMLKAAARGKNPRDRLLQSGVGYVHFALRWPQHFQVMFDLEATRTIDPQYAQSADKAFGTLVQLVVETQASGALPSGDPLPFALTAWSLVHGIAKLAISRRLPFSRSKALAFAGSASRVLLQGLEHATGASLA